MQGPGRYSIDFLINPSAKTLISIKRVISITKWLTGITIIYSAISIKYNYPNIDIGMLQITNAFTFWIPYDYFTFIMLIVEIAFGIAIIMGYRLYFISILLLGLFIFLSIDLSENFFAHNFIYGILIMLM